MNTVLWILQILLSLMFIMVGGLKMAISREKLLASGAETGRQNMAWAADFTATQIRLIGLAEALGGIGLILPAWTGILSFLTPLAALGLTVLMLGAVMTHRRRSEMSLINGPLILALLSAVIALGRFAIIPIL